MAWQAGKPSGAVSVEDRRVLSSKAYLWNDVAKVDIDPKKGKCLTP